MQQNNDQQPPQTPRPLVRQNAQLNILEHEPIRQELNHRIARRRRITIESPTVKIALFFSVILAG